MFRKNLNKNNKLISSKYFILDLINNTKINVIQKMNNIIHLEYVMHINDDKTKIIYYGKYNEKYDIIQINSLENGKLFGWIKYNKNELYLSPRWCLSGETNKKRKNMLIKKNPLKRLSTISYNDKFNEIYTGNKKCEIHLWA